jgi:hypothetical protein
MMRQFKPEKIELVFLSDPTLGSAPHRGKEQAEFVENLHKRLAEIGEVAQAYREAENVEIVPKPLPHDQFDELLDGTDIIDVTPAPKKLSVAIVAACLKNQKSRVFTLDWLVRKKLGTTLIVGKDPYDYVDLTRLEQAAVLRRSFAARARLLIAMMAAILFIGVLSFSARWFPPLAVANEFLIAMSAGVGFAGLFIAVRGGDK